jgi:hypothetical protein
MTYRFKCVQCGSICNEGEYLTAPNPFDTTDTITGCPTCKGVDSLVTACDEPGCTREATSGWAGTAGYRHTCGEHYKNEK